MPDSRYTCACLTIPRTATVSVSKYSDDGGASLTIGGYGTAGSKFLRELLARLEQHETSAAETLAPSMCSPDDPSAFLQST